MYSRSVTINAVLETAWKM